jgi:Kelch motif/3-keto-disaccharide hydrolase
MVECEMRLDRAGAGILFRRDAAGQSYAFRVNLEESSGPFRDMPTVYLERVSYSDKAASGADFQTVTMVQAPYAMSRGSWHKIKIQAVGGDLTAFIDDKQVLSFPDNKPIPAGGIGFTVHDASFKSGIAFFRNLRVRSFGAREAKAMAGPRIAPVLRIPQQWMWSAVASMPRPRRMAAAAVLGDAVYVVGGEQSGSYTFTDDVQRYDVAQDRWTVLPPCPVKCSRHCLVGYEGKLWLLGGSEGCGTKGTDVYIFDPVDGLWTKGPAMQAARGDFAAVVVGRRLYCLGGHLAYRTEIYDPDQNKFVCRLLDANGISPGATLQSDTRLGALA